MTSETTSRQSVGEAATSVGHDTASAAQDVASNAKQEAANVAGEAKAQAQQLWQQSRQELVDQTSQQQSRIVDALRSLGEELSTMAQRSDQEGMAKGVVQEASRRATSAAGWLDQRDPGSLMSEVRSFARSRPGTFLAIAAGLGVLGGRLTRGAVDESRDTTTGGGTSAAQMGVEPVPMDRTTSGGYSAYGTATDTPLRGTSAPAPVTESGGLGTSRVQEAGPLDPVDPLTGRTRTGAGRDTDEFGDEVPR